MEDARGWFFESYSQKSFQEAGLNMEFVQDNHSFSKKNVIRGLHFQTGARAQTKLVRVLAGEILDVTVDIRHDQPTFRKVFKVRLSAANQLQLLIPKGFAHGFSVLSDHAEVMYKTDGFLIRSPSGGYSLPISNWVLIGKWMAQKPLFPQRICHCHLSGT